MSPTRLSNLQREEIVGLAAGGETLTKLAETYGVTRQAVRGVLRRRGVPARSSGKLTELQRAEVVQQYLRGAAMAELAAAYGVTEPSVRGLLVRRGVVLRRTIHTLRDDAFDHLTPIACYWIGFLFADGSVSYRQGYMPQVSVGLAQRDRDHLAALRTFLGSTSSISEPSVTHGACQFSVRSVRLAGRLIELGRYEGPVDHRLVTSRDFWRGVVDGDGSIGRYKRSQNSARSFSQFRLVGKSRILEPFADFLVTQGLGRLSVRPHKTIYNIGTTCRPAERIIALLYENAVMALSRKAEAAAQILDAANLDR